MPIRWIQWSQNACPHLTPRDQAHYSALIRVEGFGPRVKSRARKLRLLSLHSLRGVQSHSGVARILHSTTVQLAAPKVDASTADQLHGSFVMAGASGSGLGLHPDGVVVVCKVAITS